jgi:hypothetical protein
VRLALALGRFVLAALAGACAGGRSGDWTPALPPSPRAGPSLVLLGEVAPGRTTRAVAEELDRVLTHEAAQGRRPIVVWLGNLALPGGPVPGEGDANCTGIERAWKGTGARDLAAVVRRHDVPTFGVLGDREWRCGHPELSLQAGPEGPHPWTMPAHNYVVRIGTDGSARVVSSCSGERPRCRIAAPVAGEAPPAAELWFVDTAPSVFAPAPRTPAAARSERSLAEQRALLAVLDDAPTPRILVSHLPVEAIGIHGQGGRYPSASHRQLPAPVRAALERGAFAGVVAAHDRSLHVTRDVGDAVKRSSKVWLAAPVFQVVSGATSRPDVRAPFLRIGHLRGTALVPDRSSLHAGFALVRLDDEHADALLRTRRAGRWQTAQADLALAPHPHAAETASPSLAPCLQCDPRQGSAEGGPPPR